MKAHVHQPRREHRKGKLLYGRLAQVRSKANSIRVAGTRKCVGNFLCSVLRVHNILIKATNVGKLCEFLLYMLSYISIPFTVYLVNDV